MVKAVMLKREVPSRKVCVTGQAMLEDPNISKGMAFSWQERSELNLHGLLPPRIESIEKQARRVMWHLNHLEDNLEKYSYIMGLSDSNAQLFYYVLSEYVTELMPIVYTPTVGLACQKFGYVYQQPKGMFITIKDLGRIHQMLKNWPVDDVKAICFTDGERILGLGDLGAFGMGIPIGKLALYTACAGVNPRQLLPVTLDVGCNREELRNDEFYIGLQQERTRGEEYDMLVEEFMTAAQKRWGPSVLIQFEDFANRNALRLLEKHKDSYCTFNDDIQGTASVALAGVYTACRFTKTKISDHKFLFLGAGSAGLGIAGLICTAMVEDDGITREEANKHIFLVDSRGLVVKDRSTGGISADKKPYAQEGYKEMKDLAEIAAAVGATAIVGVSGQPKTFTKAVCEAMAKNCEHPMIFPMSNPTSKAEASAADCYEWTNGKCVFASGSPFPPVHIEGVGEIVPAQGNNAYIFPGVALGVIATQSLRCPENFFSLAAKTLANLVSDDMLQKRSLYPPLNTIRECSFKIAVEIAKSAFKQGYATVMEPSNMEDLIRSVVFDHKTYPVYSSEAYMNLTSQYGGNKQTVQGKASQVVQ